MHDQIEMVGDNETCTGVESEWNRWVNETTAREGSEKLSGLYNETETPGDEGNYSIIGWVWRRNDGMWLPRNRQQKLCSCRLAPAEDAEEL